MFADRILAVEFQVLTGAPETRLQGEGDRLPTKERVQEVLSRLPDDCSLDDVLYHLYVVQRVERGLSDVEDGRTVPHEEVAETLRRKWVLGAAE
jgi:predicted transcriptional regulator